MRTKTNSKILWSVRVDPQLKEWFTSFAASRMTDPQEEARRALADFRKNNISDKDLTNDATG